MEDHNLNQLLVFLGGPVSESLRADLSGAGFVVVDSILSDSPYLYIENEQIHLRMPSGLQMQIDFHEPKYQRQFRPSNELLCRACGWHLGYRELWDLTAGLGVDSIMLAQAGFQVRAFERNPYLSFLLSQAQCRIVNESTQSEWARSLSFEAIDAEEAFISTAKPPEVIYYDPMYPAKRKTALPSKEMQILRELNGTSGESISLVQLALDSGARRIVVKRPHRAPPVWGKPHSVVSGKLVRFDIY